MLALASSYDSVMTWQVLDDLIKLYEEQLCMCWQSIAQAIADMPSTDVLDVLNTILALLQYVATSIEAETEAKIQWW